jgi:type VI secretion system secreted protein VgrG
MSLLDCVTTAAGGLTSGLPDLSSLTSRLSSFASAFEQTTRLVKLRLAAGSCIPANTLLPHRLTGHEAINEGFRYELEAVSSDADIELKCLLGVPVEVTILTDAGAEHGICGLVTEVSQVGADGGFATYRLVIESALSALRHRRACRVYTATNVRDLTKKILSEHIDGNAVIGASFHVDDRCAAEYVERPFWMQYNESDFDYLKRLWAREGISFVVVPSAESSGDHPQHTLILFDDPMDLDANTCGAARFHRADGTEQKDAITEWKARRFLQSGNVSRASWNHATASMMTATEPTEIQQGENGDALASTLEGYRHHMPLEDGEAGVLDRRTQIRMKALVGKAKHFEGEGTMRTFQTGSWFTLTQHPVHDQDPEQDREFMITSLDTTAVNNLPKDLTEGLPGLPGAAGLSSPSGLGGQLLKQAAKGATKPEPPCANRFTCVRRGIPILPDEIDPPRPGLLSARVVGPENEEVHVDDLHRIKVRFLFTRAEEHPESGAGDTDADSAWVRLSQMWCSQGFGSSFIPRVGDEVLIQFLGHDPDKPLVAGGISNGVKVPTAFTDVSGLPGDKTLSGIRSKMIHGQGGNELILDDTPKELRTRLACDHLASQLNLGYLVKPRCGGASFPLGEGFELKTEAWGALRADKGMLVTTDGGMSDHLENAPLTSQLDSSIGLSKTLSEVSEHHKAHQPAAIKTSQDIKKVLEGTQRQGTGAKARNVAAFSEPVLALSSPTGIVAATPSNQTISAGQDIHATSGKDTNMTVGGRLAMAIKEAWSVFTSNAGLKLIAGESDITLRAHDGELNATADQGMRVIAINGTLELFAKNGITLATPGAKFQVKDGNINIEGVNCNVYASGVNMTAPQTANVDLPKLPKSSIPEQKLNFDLNLFDTPGPQGHPLAHAPWKIAKGPEPFGLDSIEDENLIAEGETDEKGHIPLTPAQEEVLAKVYCTHPSRTW